MNNDAGLRFGGADAEFDCVSAGLCWDAEVDLEEACCAGAGGGEEEFGGGAVEFEDRGGVVALAGGVEDGDGAGCCRS